MWGYTKGWLVTLTNETFYKTYQNSPWYLFDVNIWGSLEVWNNNIAFLNIWPPSNFREIYCSEKLWYVMQFLLYVSNGIGVFSSCRR